jgi:hypothetical protein
MTTVKQIFEYIKGMNPGTSTVSSMGTFVDSMHQQMADNTISEVTAALPKDTLAYKIATTAESFSEKQLWVIAYELMKNAEFVAKVDALGEEISDAEILRKARKARKAARKANK